MPGETNMRYAMFCMFYVKSSETHVSAEVGRRPALRRSRATPMRAPGQCGPSRSPNRFPSGPCGSWEAPRQLARGVGTASGGPRSPCRRLPHPLLCPCASRSPPCAVSRHWAPGTGAEEGVGQAAICVLTEPPGNVVHYSLKIIDVE